MTTEREFQEWAEKIRRVRGQAPLRKSQQKRKMSPLLLIILFVCSLAIAAAISNRQQQQTQPNSQGQLLSESFF
ncbi:hypothetical protein [Picosynechococcus sp. NKBG15041c]|uniref:hypothetical protein n=1 Tax=Picosynechococcus sp. NKBG15041c TaxID=1407650 RepID=UPI0003FB9EC3|nr:hypothetical protein [Picosynechococcus sp. NKBG15041c]